MSVSFQSGESDVRVEVGEYQEFPTPQAVDAATERTPKPPPKPKLRHISMVLLSFGLLCILQAILNISLRLAVSEPTDGGKGAERGGGEPEEESCPQSWRMFGSSCYYISSQTGSWDKGRWDCLQRDADLVIINSRQEQDFLSEFRSRALWVGMTDRKEEGTWIWVDGTPVNMDRLQWAPGQPDDAFGGEDCGELHRETNFSGLNDYNCLNRFRWICEKSLA